MGRPSKLTPAQQLEAESRIYAGETYRSVARAMNCNESTLRNMFATKKKDVKTVVDQIVAAETALRELPVSAQFGALNLAAQLMSITNNLASAAHHGATISSRMMALAAKRSSRVDSEDPGVALRATNEMGVFMKAANMAAEIPLNLISKNKDAMDGLVQDELKPKKNNVRDLTDDQLKEEAAKYGIVV